MYKLSTITSSLVSQNTYAQSPVSPSYVSAPTVEKINLGCHKLEQLNAQWWNYYINALSKVNAIAKSMLTSVVNAMMENLTSSTIIDGSKNALLNEIKETERKLILKYKEIGQIFIWSSNNAPVNYLLLNGQSFDRNTYPELYDILGTNKLPDFRELCPRGIGKNNNIVEHIILNNVNDFNKCFLFIEDGFPTHTHGFSGIDFNQDKVSARFNDYRPYYPLKWSKFTTKSTIARSIYDVAHVNRDRQIGVNFIIKAK